LERADHVALGSVAVRQRLILAAERETAEKDQPVGIVILPQPPGGALAARLLDDGQQVALDLDVAEEGFEALVSASLGRRLAELDQPAIVAAGCRRRPRQCRAALQQVPLPTAL